MNVFPDPETTGRYDLKDFRGRTGTASPDSGTRRAYAHAEKTCRHQRRPQDEADQQQSRQKQPGSYKKIARSSLERTTHPERRLSVPALPAQATRRCRARYRSNRNKTDRRMATGSFSLYGAIPAITKVRDALTAQAQTGRLAHQRIAPGEAGIAAGAAAAIRGRRTSTGKPHCRAPFPCRLSGFPRWRRAQK